MSPTTEKLILDNQVAIMTTLDVLARDMDPPIVSTRMRELLARRIHDTINHQRMHEYIPETLPSTELEA
jgi:hypothetical protein